MNRNPEKNQDRFQDTFDHFNRWGYVLFPQDRRIYERLAETLHGRNVIEAGCGQGTGTGILSRECNIIGTDKEKKNVDFARALYPWISFFEWNITRNPFGETREVVVAVEVIEHVEKTQRAIDNLIASATREVWISTPNGRRLALGSPPSNPYHVWEWTPAEIMGMFGQRKIEVYDWETWKIVDNPVDTLVDPVVYHVIL